MPLSGLPPFCCATKHYCGLRFRHFWPPLWGAFASCISQYVMVVADSGFAEKVVAVVLPVNAVIVVSLQYAVGRRLTAVNIRPMMTTGTVFLSPGSSDLFFQATICFWGLSAAVFTIGEIIYAPANIC